MYGNGDYQKKLSSIPAAVFGTSLRVSHFTCGKGVKNLKPAISPINTTHSGVIVMLRVRIVKKFFGQRWLSPPRKNWLVRLWSVHHLTVSHALRRNNLRSTYRREGLYCSPQLLSAQRNADKVGDDDDDDDSLSTRRAAQRRAVRPYERGRKRRLHDSSSSPFVSSLKPWF